MSREEFAFVVLSYFVLEDDGNEYRNSTCNCQMFKKFEFPDCLVDNVRKIESSIDITLVREVIQGKPLYFEWMEESEELRNLVVSNIPEDFDELEIAYYIYYKLCKILIYGYIYFTERQTMRGF